MTKKTRRHRGASKKITLKDVAKAANVSTFTVSRALSNAPGVNAETRDLILETSRRLGVRPRAAAKQGQFALVIPDPDGYKLGTYVPTLGFQLLHELASRGFGLTLFSDSQIQNIHHHIFDGIFALTWSEASIEAIAAIENTPRLVINRFSLASRFHVVGWDHREEGRIVAEYLIAHGHRRLAFVAEPPRHLNSTQSRLAGYREQCVASGLALSSNRVELLESREHLAPALSRVLNHGADAIYIPGQGRLGPEAVNILRTTMKVRVPEDVSVVSGEHAGWSALFDPPLTTVDAPLELLAKHCVDHMIKLVNQSPTEPTEVLLATPIIERKSVLEREAPPLAGSSLQENPPAARSAATV